MKFKNMNFQVYVFLSILNFFTIPLVHAIPDSTEQKFGHKHGRVDKTRNKERQKAQNNRGLQFPD